MHSQNTSKKAAPVKNKGGSSTKTEIEKSWLKKNWFALLALFVAAFGGCPGVFSIVDHFKNRPVFRFRLVSTATAEGFRVVDGQKSSDHMTMVMLVGTASNQGRKPITPARFELNVQLDGKLIPFERQLIQKKDVYESEELDIHMEDPSSKDLQKFAGRLDPGVPNRGYLRFVSYKVDLQSLRQAKKIRLHLSCVDIFDKKYVEILTPDSWGEKVDSGKVYPKHGLTVRPKQPSSSGNNDVDTPHEQRNPEALQKQLGTIREKDDKAYLEAYPLGYVLFAIDHKKVVTPLTDKPNLKQEIQIDWDSMKIVDLTDDIITITPPNMAHLVFKNIHIRLSRTPGYKKNLIGIKGKVMSTFEVVEDRSPEGVICLIGFSEDKPR